MPSAFLVLPLLILCLSACAGLPARGSLGGQVIDGRVDSEIARYYLANYLQRSRSAPKLDERIDGVYRSNADVLPDRAELKHLSDELSTDFAALYFAERLASIPENRRWRLAYDRLRAEARNDLRQSAALLAFAAADYEIVFVPGYLYKRHRATGADLAAPRSALEKAGLSPGFIETSEDGTIEANSEIVAAALRARAAHGRRLILVSVSKSGAEVAEALTRLGADGARRVAAWVNIAGILQGSALADEGLAQWQDWIGQVDIAGIESLSTARSRERFAGFRVPPHVLVVNYIGVPLADSVSWLGRSGYTQLRAHGPNDGLSLLPDLIYPGAATLAELGRDHFLVDDQTDGATIALALTIVQYLDQRGRDSPPVREAASPDSAADFRVEEAMKP
jgi:hypothetical protein